MKKRTPNPEKIRQALDERCPHGNLVICHQCLADRNRVRINPLAQLAPGTHYIEVADPEIEMIRAMSEQSEARWLEQNRGTFPPRRPEDSNG